MIQEPCSNDCDVFTVFIFAKFLEMVSHQTYNTQLQHFSCISYDITPLFFGDIERKTIAKYLMEKKMNMLQKNNINNNVLKSYIFAFS